MKGLTVSLGDETPLKAGGESYGDYSPPLRDVRKFKANNFFYTGSPNQPQALAAFEQLDDGRQMGVLIFVAVVGNQLEVRSVGGLVDDSIYLNNKSVIKNLIWEPGIQASMHFEFDFRFENIDYHLTGSLLLRFE
ncbi:hypothetical protein [Pseudomonas sp. CCOS 191]|uniref:hypothetical protein n=1 Tax=Pseudomonas sp. CCOS 191 TaxID=1649877 RepID=UPI0006245D49|nr:hypothetical protein [Pseudomonas sp. CCOS 191]CRI57679.1 hypothetical protein CCOS191_3143 [Pseudomonas sp. CCOS 191]